MNVLGVHASFALSTHDPGVCLISDGTVKGIYEEERFNRIKLARGHFPLYSLKSILNDNNISIKDIDYIATTGITNNWIKEKIKAVVEYHFGSCPEIKQVHHQRAHMWCALMSGAPRDTNFVCIDAFGDGASGSYGQRVGNTVEATLIDKENSLGNFYAIGTSLLGFTAGEDEYKVMGLAAYGSKGNRKKGMTEDLFEMFMKEETFNHVSKIRNNYEDFSTPKIANFAREIYGDISNDFEARTQLAFDIQESFEQKVLEVLEKCTKEYPDGEMNVALAGGCALNCQANMIASERGYNVYVSPVSSDRGIALGSALAVINELGMPIEKLNGICYGQTVNSREVEEELRNNGLLANAKRYDAKEIAKNLASGEIIGLCDGPSEAGARALGRRSILADPTLKGMKDKLNKKIKYREAFRPFAPAVLDEDGHHFFKNYQTSRYMTRNFRSTSFAEEKIPECIHANQTARVQSVVKEDGKIYEILKEMKGIHSYGVLINTSFNLKGQPIVQTARDALGTFYQCGIDRLIIGDYVLSK